MGYSILHRSMLHTDTCKDNTLFCTWLRQFALRKTESTILQAKEPSPIWQTHRTGIAIPILVVKESCAIISHFARLGVKHHEGVTTNDPYPVLTVRSHSCNRLALQPHRLVEMFELQLVCQQVMAQNLVNASTLGTHIDLMVSGFQYIHRCTIAQTFYTFRLTTMQMKLHVTNRFIRQFSDSKSCRCGCHKNIALGEMKTSHLPTLRLPYMLYPSLMQTIDAIKGSKP